MRALNNSARCWPLGLVFATWPLVTRMLGLGPDGRGQARWPSFSRIVPIPPIMRPAERVGGPGPRHPWSPHRCSAPGMTVVVLRWPIFRQLGGIAVRGAALVTRPLPGRRSVWRAGYYSTTAPLDPTYGAGGLVIQNSRPLIPSVDFSPPFSRRPAPSNFLRFKRSKLTTRLW